MTETIRCSCEKHDSLTEEQARRMTTHKEGKALEWIVSMVDPNCYSRVALLIEKAHAGEPAEPDEEDLETDAKAASLS